MTFQIDHAHSQVLFTVRHMMISKVRGSFEKFDGSIQLDEQHPENTKVDVKIDVASIDTGDEKRDAHLRSADFFDAEKFPFITFKSKRVEMKNDQHARLIGDLTIHGITKETPLEVDFNGKAKSPWGTTSFGFDGHTVINRKDWNLTWNQALETGGVLVGDEITINIELELVQQEAQAGELAEKEAELLEQSR